MKKLLSLLILGIILLTTIVSAEVYENNLIRYGTIDPNGVLTSTNTPINNANVIGFVCSSSRCATVSSRLWPGTLSTTNDFIRLVYPTTLQSQFGYAVIVYKDGYIPFGINPNWAGNGDAPGNPYYDYLTKKEICGPKVLDYSISNNCKTINVMTKVRAPISKAGIIDYYPEEIRSQFTSNVDVTLEIRKDNEIDYTETKKVNLFFSEEKDVTFSYVTTRPGTYSVKIITTTDEPRCMTHATDTKTKDLTIPACCSKTDCGTDRFVDGLFCKSDDIFQKFLTFTCVNPGSSDSYCKNSTDDLFKVDCGTNSCTDYSDNYCKGNSVYKSRTCYDKGCSYGKCFSNSRIEEVKVEDCSNICSNGKCIEKINCTKDQDCGTNGFIGNLFCQSDDVFQNFITYKCINPNTKESYCTNSTCGQFKLDCGTDSCTDYGENFCKNNNLYKSRTCTDKGCSYRECFSTNSTDEVLVMNCTNGCSNNKCNPPKNITCYNNTQCGIDGFIDSPFCKDNNIFKKFITFTCNYPGTEQSFCSNSTCDRLLQNCPIGCNNGTCITPVCTKDLDCGNVTTRKYCDGKKILKDTTTPTCINNSCINKTTTTTIKTCSHECEDASCITPEPVHNPCEFPDDLNCPTKEKPVIYKNNDINYSFINNTAIKLETKPVEKKYTCKACNQKWFWFMIIFLLLLLIILVIIFILWLLGSRIKKK